LTFWRAVLCGGKAPLTVTQALYDEAKKDGWFVISMKNEWNRIFAFEE
jgi:hypothetical protein